MFPPLQHISKNRRDQDKFDKAMRAAKEHVRFCIELHRMQMKAGRYFLHEHPSVASSWDMTEVKEMLMMMGVGAVTCDMCAYGLTITDAEGDALAEKRTRLMSNSPEILKRVDKQCANKSTRSDKDKHRHANTHGGGAWKCQVYPR